ncbi:MAG: hypothetical protein ACFB10_09835 [Salibacteraceae bacterium]
MKSTLFFLLLLVGPLVGGSPDKASSSKVHLPFLLGGIQVNEPDHQKWVETLHGDGMNTVSVTVYAKQGDWDSDNLWWEAEEAAVVREIQTAKASGLRVVLILRVALDHAFERNEFFWHGMILPKTPPLLDSWFEKYTRFVTQWAAIAEAEQVDVFAVGSEMNALSATLPVEDIPALDEYYLNKTKQLLYSKGILQYSPTITDRHLWTPGPNEHKTISDYLEAREAAHRHWAQVHSFDDTDSSIAKINDRAQRLNTHWEHLIDETRKIYQGPVTYAANFDNYYDVGFWKKLDFMGINAYFPLRNAYRKPTRETVSFPTFKESWERVFQQINGFKQSQEIKDCPVIFTELGYTFRKNCSIEPWSSYGFSVIGKPPRGQLVIWQDQPVDYQERSLAVKALHAVTSKMGPGQFQGILYWKLTSIKSHIDIEPFVLHLGPESQDPLKAALRRFTERP